MPSPVPTLPTEGHAQCLKVMADLIPWVRSELPKAFPKAKSMHKCQPLSIQADAKTNDLTGFKAGSWSTAECEAALTTTGVYEAPGLALWLRTNALGVGPDAEEEDVNWQSLKQFEAAFFSKSGSFKTRVTRSTAGGKKQKIEKSRMFWPCVMVCGIETAKHALHDHFDAALPLLGSGQFVLWAWFLALFRALQAADKEWLEMLWECGLSVTVQVRICTSPKELALARHNQSEAIKSLGHASMSDSFSAFSILTCKLGITSQKAGEDLGLHFNGTLYNAAMHKAAVSLASVLRSPGGIVEKALRKLELEFGRDILSNEYSKLSKLISVAKATASSRMTTPEMVAWMIEMLTLAFRSKIRMPSRATDQWLDKDRKTGALGFWPVTQVILQVFDYAQKLIDSLPEPEVTKCKAILSDLLCPQTCWEKYVYQEQQDAPLGEDDCEGSCVADIPSGPLAEAKQNFNRATGLLLDLLLKVALGRDFFSECQEIAATPGGLSKAMQSAEEQACSLQSTVQVPRLLKELRSITVQFDGQSKSVSVSAAAPPPSLLMHLSRDGAAAESEAERETTWKKVQAERRKFVTFSYPRTWAKDHILNAFRSSGKVFSYTGELNSAHRLFVASADLLHEEGDEPWNAPCPPAASMWKEITSFITSTSGPADFAMLFDGRMREIRRQNEDSILTQNHSGEGHVVFAGGCPPRAGRSRKVPLSAKKVESIAILCPVSRSKIKANKKEQFTACGEESTYQGTYSGVSYRSGAEIPLISPLEKSKVLPQSTVQSPQYTGQPVPPDDWAERNGSDIPLFWSESKPIALWAAVIDDWKVATIFDCSPGSGALMEAAMTRGVFYHGLCLNKEHLQWLQAVADRAACGLMALEGSTLFSEENSIVKKHFPDVIAGLARGRDDEEDEQMEPASENEGCS